VIKRTGESSAVIPFTAEVLFSLYGRYNTVIGVMPVVGYALCIMALLMVFRPFAGSDRVISATFAAMFIWVGAVFHFGHMAPLNWGAWVFGAFFIVEGVLFAWLGGVRERLIYRPRPGLAGAAGFALLVFALAYPVLDVLLGHRWPQLQLPGTLPAPTVLATMAFLLMAPSRTALGLSIIPLLWALIDGAAAAFLGIWQDVAMAIAVCAAILLLLFATRRRS
jgi:hypothetical protein